MAQSHLQAQQGPYCGARSIQNKLEYDAIWVRSKSNTSSSSSSSSSLIYDDEPYYTSCKYIHARYNCTRFNNSATHYRIDFRTHTTSHTTSHTTAVNTPVRNKCRLPSRHSIIRILERRPINLFFVGILSLTTTITIIILPLSLSSLSSLS